MLRYLKYILVLIIIGTQIGCNNESGKSAPEPVINIPLSTNTSAVKNECPAIRQNIESNKHSLTPGVRLTPLMRAAYVGNAQKVQTLLSRGENIDMKDRYGRTALQYAVLGGKLNTFTLLFRAGANIHIQNTFKASAVHLAAIWNRTEIIKLMVTSGRLDINTTSKFLGLTMLHSAAANCNLDLIQFLVQHGADVNKKSADIRKNELLISGRTPLKEALAVNATESVNLLLQLGADPNL